MHVAYIAIEVFISATRMFQIVLQPPYPVTLFGLSGCLFFRLQTISASDGQRIYLGEQILVMRAGDPHHVIFEFLAVWHQARVKVLGPFEHGLFWRDNEQN